MAHTHKLKDGVRVALTADEITQLNANDLAWANGKNDRTMANLRAKRDQLLKDTDWEIVKATDRGTGVQQNLKDYRQALRDLPSNYTTTDGKSLEENLSNLTLPTRG